MSDETKQEELGATFINERKGKAEAPKKEKTILGDFEMQKRLGQGGMGEVFLARQISLDRAVAIKLLSKEMAKKKGSISRHQHEGNVRQYREGTETPQILPLDA